MSKKEKQKPTNYYRIAALVINPVVTIALIAIVLIYWNPVPIIAFAVVGYGIWGYVLSKARKFDTVNGIYEMNINKRRSRS